MNEIVAPGLSTSVLQALPQPVRQAAPSGLFSPYCRWQSRQQGIRQLSKQSARAGPAVSSANAKVLALIILRMFNPPNHPQSGGVERQHN